jgi:hypothetical protein
VAPPNVFFLAIDSLRAEDSRSEVVVETAGLNPRPPRYETGEEPVFDLGMWESCGAPTG